MILRGPFETFILLDTLKSETPSLSFEDGNRLYKNVLEDYSSERSKYKQFLKVKKNPFFNSLQVKYSYAITCHKSQGGQWENVFIEKPYLNIWFNIGYMIFSKKIFSFFSKFEKFELLLKYLV